MQTSPANPPCPGCATRDAALAQLQEQMHQLQQQVDALQDALARAQKTSSNSSKPPSSDIVKPPKAVPKKGRKRRQGGQPGHAKHERTFSLDQADTIHTHTLTQCPGCAGQSLIVLPDVGRTTYQYEIVEKPIQLHAHQAGCYWCPACERAQEAPLPSQVRHGGLLGPRLTGLIGYLKGSGHLSYTTLQALLAEGLDTPLSTGLLAKAVHKVSGALAPIYHPLLEALPAQKILNIDETGHKDQGRLLWTWCFGATDFTVFTIAASRGSQVLEKILGAECEAVLGHDYFSAYRAYMKKAPVATQFCLAHLIRELRFASQSLTPAIAAYGQRLLDQLKALFKLIHRRDQLKPETFVRRLTACKTRFLQKARRTQAGGAAAQLAKRFRLHGNEYFTFISQPDIEPTNNVAERALRFCVIDRRITQGTRGLNGQQWCERFWTIQATCRQQGKSVCRFIQQAIHAAFQGTPPPSLLPA